MGRSGIPKPAKPEPNRGKIARRRGKREGRLGQLLTARSREPLAGVLSCYDRIIVTGTLPGACYAKGMTGFLSARQIRIFDYPRFAEPLRDRVRERAAELASAAGITIEHLAKKQIRKEDVVARVLVVRGDRPGLVQRVQALADTLSPDPLPRILDHYAQQCCPVLDVFAHSYHWSFMQVEYATDLVFRTPAILKPLYEQLSRQAILTVKAEHVATFLGHKITAQLAQEIGSQFTTRIEGTCVKHRFSKSSIKIYDKFDLVLRIETTTNDVSAFKHYRKVEHRQGPATRALAPVRKTIYTLKDLREILLGCNRRYLEYLSSLDDFSAGIRALDRLPQPRPVKGRNL